MEPEPARDITRFLRRAGHGDKAAMDRVMPFLYQELRDRASNLLRRERSPSILQTTAVVNEVYLRMERQNTVSWVDRAHFYAVASTCIRRILIDHARSRKAVKRGGDAGQRVTLDDQRLEVRDSSALLELNDALERLSEQDARKGRMVELRYFGGLQNVEVAEVLGVSLTTVERELRMARAWLHRELSGRSSV